MSRSKAIHRLHRFGTKNLCNLWMALNGVDRREYQAQNVPANAEQRMQRGRLTGHAK